MYIPRDIDEVLASWYGAEGRKPLVLRGARQTGKSTSVRRFGEGTPCLVELNLERFEDLRLTRGVQGAGELLDALRIREERPGFPEGTLLFIDEIQENPAVIGWLRFLHEDHPEIAVVVAGSLLDVRLRGEGFSFPVGRVTFRRLGPLSYFEFLEGRGRYTLAGALREAAAPGGTLSRAVHDDAMGQLRDYLLVGGMPEAVTHSMEAGPLAAAEVHRDLRQAFAEDIQKYRTGTDAIEAAFASLRQHYGLRFKYENFAPGRRSMEMQDALRTLESALILHRALPSSSLSLPIEERPRVAPKLLPLDIGLALTDFGLPREELDRLPLEDLLGGRFAECFVGQQLLASTDRAPERLHFWVRERADSGAELDFLLPAATGLLPLEVKSGKSGRLRSLHEFLHRSRGRVGVRLWSEPPADDDQEIRLHGQLLKYRLISLPLYLAGAVGAQPGGWMLDNVRP